MIINALIHGFDGIEQGEIVCDITEQDGEVRIEFRDNGVGMSPDQLSKIFDPFFTTKRSQGGSGLGLNIIRNLVEHRLGGTIWCESRAGAGTSFFIAFPQQTWHEKTNSTQTSQVVENCGVTCHDVQEFRKYQPFMR